MNLIKVIALVAVVVSVSAYTEEGGSGHYMPGSMSSFIDGVPPEQTFIARLNVLEYSGSYQKEILFAGLNAANIDASTKAVALTLLYRPDIDLGKNWSYAISTTIPYLDMQVSADVENDADRLRRTDTDKALGDIILMPLMLNQMINADLNINYRVALYAPTGSYQVGSLANTSKNFWTIEPTIAAVYLGQKNGIEASVYAGLDFNAENKDTQYKSGVQGRIEATVAQHFPLWGGLAGAGLTGFYYKQISGDSGEGATFGHFKARSVGAGPTLSFIKTAGNTDILAELKWLHEFSTAKRLEGDTIYLKLVAKF